MEIELVASLAVLAITLIVFLKQKRSFKKKLPPGPPCLPLIGNIHQLGHPLHKILHKHSQACGEIMLLKFGSVNTVVLSSDDVTREIIKTHDITFGSRAVSWVIRRLTYNATDISFSPLGDYWREIRKIAILELLSMKKIQSFRPARQDQVRILLDAILKQNGSSFNLSELLHVFSNNLICRIAFGKKFVEVDSRSKNAQKLLQETQTLIGTIGLSDFFPSMEWINKFNGREARVEKNFYDLDEIYETVIQEHMDTSRQKPESDNLVDALLKIQKDKTRSVSKVPTFIKAMLTDVFIAGTDTTAATLIWAMTELMRSPSSMKKAIEEVRSLAKEKSELMESELSQLPYLKAVIKETLRLHPPTPLMVPRETVQEVEIRGYTIPAKTTVLINAYSMAMDPKSWEIPEEFRPERFLESQVDFRGGHYELIPFGVGRRACPGMNFAVGTIEKVIASLLLWFDWELPNGVAIEDVDMREAIGIVVFKETPLMVVAKPVKDVRTCTFGMTCK